VVYDTMWKKNKIKEVIRKKLFKIHLKHVILSYFRPNIWL